MEPKPNVRFPVNWILDKSQRLVLAARMADEKNPHAVAMGSIKSKRKAAAARRNGKKGGRPKKVRPHPPLTDRDARAIRRHCKAGNEAAARKIVEGAGLKWLNGWEKKQ